MLLSNLHTNQGKIQHDVIIISQKNIGLKGKNRLEITTVF